MVVFVYPYIDPAEYGCFRKIDTLALPEVFGEWDYFVMTKLADTQGRGHRGIRQKIHFDEFISFCETHHRQKTKDFLDEFAQAKAEQLGLFYKGRVTVYPGSESAPKSNDCMQVARIIPASQLFALPFKH